MFGSQSGLMRTIDVSKNQNLNVIKFVIGIIGTVKNVVPPM